MGIVLVDGKCVKSLVRGDDVKAVTGGVGVPSGQLQISRVVVLDRYIQRFVTALPRRILDTNWKIVARRRERTRPAADRKSIDLVCERCVITARPDEVRADHRF